MTRPAKLLDSRGNPIRTDGMRRPRESLSARYDAAQTSHENRKHWAEADHLSARAANSLDVRRKLRDRARYEAANNGWLSGIADSLADWLIGEGPTLQMQTDDEELNGRLEEAFGEWSESVGLADKLWLMRRTKAIDGEAFMFFETDEDLGDVTLDLRLYDCDQVSTPFPYPLDPLRVDGIQFNTRMKPIEYHLLRVHPGDLLLYGYSFEFDRVPARFVVHWFASQRPQQYRGVPEVTPVLDLFAQLRRYGLATLAAAETAADFAAILESQLPPDDTDGETEELQALQQLEIEKRMMTVMPAGYKLAQLRAEQPSQGYSEFVKQKLAELARPFGMPFGIAAGDYSGYNYSSGRLDNQNFYRKTCVERKTLERICLNRILSAFIAEAAYIPGLAPGGLSRPGGWPHRWLWPGMEHVDPEKEARATQIELETGMTTFTDECYARGLDPDQQFEKLEREAPRWAELGFTPYGKTQPAQPSQPMAAPSDTADQTDETVPQNGYASHNGHTNGRHRWRQP